MNNESLNANPESEPNDEISAWLKRPDYISQDYVAKLVWPLLMLTGLGLVTNIVRLNFVIAAVLCVQLAAIYLSAVHYKLERSYSWFLCGVVVLPGVLVFYAVLIYPLTAICWTFVVTFYLYVAVHYHYAKFISPLLIFSWTTYFFFYMPLLDALRFCLTLSLVSWGLYTFTRMMAKQFDEAKHLSSIDSLTGVFNRRVLNERIEQWLAYKQRYPDESVMMAMLDLDYFKMMNDRYGHKGGDQALCKFAQTVSGRLRATDVLARFGGEEFVIVFPKTSAAQAWSILAEIRAELMEMPLECGEVISFSSGLAELNVGESAEAWMLRADKAMYQAKEDGRGRDRFA